MKVPKIGHTSSTSMSECALLVLFDSLQKAVSNELFPFKTASLIAAGSTSINFSVSTAYAALLFLFVGILFRFYFPKKLMFFIYLNKISKKTSIKNLCQTFNFFSKLTLQIIFINIWYSAYCEKNSACGLGSVE